MCMLAYFENYQKQLKKIVFPSHEYNTSRNLIHRGMKKQFEAKNIFELFVLFLKILIVKFCINCVFAI